MNIQNVLKMADERKDELFELLSSLVKIKSENFDFYGEEEEVAKYIYSLCQELGLETQMYSPLSIDGFTSHPDYWPGPKGKALENRYNVTARWAGEEDADELHLMAHSDTVPVGDVANWDKDPFSGEISDGKIWGRGACDDKYGIATYLFAIKILKDAGFKPKKNLLATAFVDEERGGSHGALAGVLKYPAPHTMCLDCKENQVWHCGSGGGEGTFTFHTNKPVDSAYLAASALPIVIEEIEKFGDKRRAELENNPFYKGTIIPKTALRYMDVHAGDHANDLGVGKVSIQFYTDKQKAVIEDELSELGERISERLAPLDITYDGFQFDTRFFHYVECSPDSEDIKTLLEASKEATGSEPKVCGSCLSDLSAIAKNSTGTAFSFGAGREFSAEGGAHQPNEFIECDKLLAYAKTIITYIIKMLG